jgi:hypothetical protein
MLEYPDLQYPPASLASQHHMMLEYPDLQHPPSIPVSKGVAEEVHGLCGKLADVELICLVKTGPGHG